MYSFIRLLCAALLIALCAPSWAVSPEIQAQQQQLKAEQSIWDTVKLPEGIDVQAKEPGNRSSGHKQVSLYGQNLFFTYTGDLQFDIKKLIAILEPTQPDVPVVLNDITTFSIEVQQGDILLSTKTLEYIFNRHVLNYDKRPLKDVSISVEGNEMVIDTDMRLKPPFPGPWMGARIKGSVSLDESQRISIDVSSLEVFKLPLAWAMHLLKLDLDQFITLERPGIELVDRSIKIDLSILPPPKLNGNLSDVALQSEGMRMEFTSDQEILFDQPPIVRDSYLWLQSGDVRIADMVILNGHLQAVSTNENERVLFNLYQCRDQISKGSLRFTERGEVIAFLPREF